MLSMLLLLGLLPAGLFFAGESDKPDPSDEDEGEDGADNAPALPTTPLDQFVGEDPPPVSDTGTAPEEPTETAAQGPSEATGPARGGPVASEPQATQDEGQTDPPLSPAPQLPEPDPQAAENEETPEDGEEDTEKDFMLGPEDGDTRIEGFRPSQDVLDIEVKNSEVIGFRSLDPETGEAQLRLFHGEGEQVITFGGLGKVPVDDIFLLMTDPETGDAISLALAGFLFNEADALEPVSAEEPSSLTAPDDPPDPVVEPTPPVSETPATEAPDAQSAAEAEEDLEAAQQIAAQATLTQGRDG